MENQNRSISLSPYLDDQRAHLGERPTRYCGWWNGTWQDGDTETVKVVCADYLPEAGGGVTDKIQ